MAELDDFFAKKDKKKNKGARTGAPLGKFSTADQVARRLENSEAPPPARPRPKKDKSDEPAGANVRNLLLSWIPTIPRDPGDLACKELLHS